MCWPPVEIENRGYSICQIEGKLGLRFQVDVGIDKSRNKEFALCLDP
jgi:hypothetical protein